MRAYEVIYILRPNLDEEQITAEVDRFTNLITGQGGEIEQVTRWGKRRLGYEIKKFMEGFYILTHFRGEPRVAEELDRVFKISENILHHLIVRRPEKAVQRA